jgi:hypothetical protein
VLVLKSHVFAHFDCVWLFPLSATQPAFSDLHVSLTSHSFLIQYSPLITTNPPTTFSVSQLVASVSHARQPYRPQTKPSQKTQNCLSPSLHPSIFPSLSSCQDLSSIISPHQLHPMPLVNCGPIGHQLLHLLTRFCYLHHHGFHLPPIQTYATCKLP